MNVFNRLFMILLCLASLAFGIIVLLLLGKIIAPGAVSPSGFFQEQWNFFTHLNTEHARTAILVSIVMILVGFFLLILELRPGRRKKAPYRYQSRQPLETR